MPLKKSITTRLCSAVLSKIVEWFEPRMTWVSAPAIPSAIACWPAPPGPWSQGVIRSSSPPSTSAGDVIRGSHGAQVHVAHRLTRGGEDLDPVRVAEDLLDRVDRGNTVRGLEEGLGERLPGDQLGEDAATGPVRVERGDVDPVLEDEPARRGRAWQRRS